MVVLHKVEELRKVCEDERVVWLERWPARPHLAMFSILHGHLLQILELLVNLSTKNWKVPNHQSTQQHHQEPVKQAVERRRSQHSAPLAERGRDATNLPAEVEELLARALEQLEQLVDGGEDGGAGVVWARRHPPAVLWELLVQQRYYVFTS